MSSKRSVSLGPRRKSTKRKYVKKTRVNLDRTPILYGRTPGLPKQHKCILRYVEAVPLTMTVAAMSKYVFRCNSIFDPNYTGVGHQPLGHDQWNYFWDRYMVTKSVINVHYVDSSNQSGPGIVFGVHKNDNVVWSPTYLEQAVEQDHRFKVSPLGLDGEPRMVSNCFDAVKDLKIKDPMDNDNYGAAMGSNPAEGMFFHLWAAPFDNSTNLDIVKNFLVIIEYHVTFHVPKTLGAS